MSPRVPTGACSQWPRHATSTTGRPSCASSSATARSSCAAEARTDRPGADAQRVERKAQERVERDDLGDLSAADPHVIGERVGELGGDRAHLAPDAAEIVEEPGPRGRKLCELHALSLPVAADGRNRVCGLPAAGRRPAPMPPRRRRARVVVMIGVIAWGPGALHRAGRGRVAAARARRCAREPRRRSRPPPPRRRRARASRRPPDSRRLRAGPRGVRRARRAGRAPPERARWAARGARQAADRTRARACGPSASRRRAT